MCIKEQKYYLTLNGAQLRQLIEYLNGARNCFIDKGIPTDDVDEALIKMMKLGKHKHKTKLY